MAIKSISVSNFKSFNHLEVQLGPFNVLIGANASGKSNFVQIFRFLRDIAEHGLRNAISMQGGVHYITNIGIGARKPLLVRVAAEGGLFVTRKGDQFMAVKADEKVYEFAISLGRSESDIEISKDRLTVELEIVKVAREDETVKVVREVGVGDVVVAVIDGEFQVHVNLPEGGMVEEDDILVIFEREEPLPSRSLVVEMPYFLLRPPLGEEFLGDISIYDFDPKLPKQAIPISGKMELEDDGSNLAIVLRNILEDEERRRKFLNLLKDVLGFVDAVEVMPLADRSLLFALQETYSNEELLPASFLSDGTIHVIALIIALYFDEKSLVIIEEPERNIHPALIARVVDMLKEASEKKQIIVTTHNPEVVKHAGVENILLVSRDKEGFSTISRPGESEEVAVFLKNEIGIEDLFLQDLLGA